MKINDIAKLANVSKSAVSLALNGKNGVSQATREKILKIAQEHGYIPRPVVKAEKYTASKSNHKLLRFVACTNEGIVTEQYESQSFFTELINSIEKCTKTNGYSLLVSSINVEKLYEEISELENEQKSSGILLLGTNLTSDQIRTIAMIQPNIVVLDTCFETLNINFVVMNNLYGAYQAGEYLIRNGHSDIGYVRSTDRMYNFNMREEGFLQALEENDLSITKDNIFEISPTTISSQKELEDKLKKRLTNLPTALFCECDYMAISVMKTLNELDIKVPDQVSVVGFDNIFESKVLTPELTTVNVKKDKIASLSVEKLIQIIEQQDADNVKVFVDTDFIERDSSIAYKKEAMVDGEIKSL
ncbi:LacI family DNA-binding transcriptional regulator [Sediminibacillus massiliensis]|uniref:LacI family DNA-binding transcriptional regulator n=1 Tax=Sediminibacillus massiliensis TaxID=1926277 RepID=UPI00098864BB|nr:LacI family DNA-binding transcriptional regulator [Sediminibacillus massiliensis]